MQLLSKGGYRTGTWSVGPNVSPFESVFGFVLHVTQHKHAAWGLQMYMSHSDTAG